MEEELTGRRFEAYVREALRLKTCDGRMYSPLVYAYIGDAVYETIIRTIIVNRGNCPVNKMHRASSELVRASAQAKLAELIMGELTEEEQAVYRRGRNAHSATMAKHATVKDYRAATGFEALIGYLYLNERKERLIELVSVALQRKGEFESDEI